MMFQRRASEQDLNNLLPQRFFSFFICLFSYFFSRGGAAILFLSVILKGSLQLLASAVSTTAKMPAA
jgi:hypothetical protein